MRKYIRRTIIPTKYVLLTFFDASYAILLTRK